MSEEIKKDKNEKLTAKEFFGFSEVLGYFFRKKNPSRPKNFSLKMMHGVNKISIIMFLIALIVIVVRFISRA